jgi:hypothetical protein
VAPTASGTWPAIVHEDGCEVMTMQSDELKLADQTSRHTEKESSAGGGRLTVLISETAERQEPALRGPRSHIDALPAAKGAS